MVDFVKALLLERGITLSAPLSLSACKIKKPYLLAREDITEGTAFLFAVPYYTTNCERGARNISAYAVSRDYHLFFATLFDEILPILRKAYPEHRFAGFVDHSPIEEVDAAVRAGLGYLGENHLFLTDEHSSFVFLGEIVTSAKIDTPTVTPRECLHCGACRRACPVGLDVTRCLSALTQKKGVLTEEEKSAVRANGSLWGCDVCQEACPITRRAAEKGTLYTKIPFFTESAIPVLDEPTLANMSDEEFSKRAYSWRGRDVLCRNLAIFKEGE